MNTYISVNEAKDGYVEIESEMMFPFRGSMTVPEQEAESLQEQLADVLGDDE